MKKIIFILVICMLTISCNSSKKVAKTNSASSEVVYDSNYWFKISFFSRGEGTDANAINAFQQFLNDYQSKNNVTLKYQTLPWGKEGEFDYSFMLSELSKKQKKEFVSQTKELLKKYSLIAFAEKTKK